MTMYMYDSPKKNSFSSVEGNFRDFLWKFRKKESVGKFTQHCFKKIYKNLYRELQWMIGGCFLNIYFYIYIIYHSNDRPIKLKFAPIDT